MEFKFWISAHSHCRRQSGIVDKIIARGKMGNVFCSPESENEPTKKITPGMHVLTPQGRGNIKSYRGKFCALN